MAATFGSIYQVILQNHISGSPPTAYPQTSFETFSDYQQRMAGAGFNVDINITESDASYLVRLASYTPTPPAGHKLWGYFTIGSGSQMSLTSPGLSGSRIGVGQYAFSFNYPVNNPNYPVLFQGLSGSLTQPTASTGIGINQTTTNFTMSVFNDVLNAAKDCNTGSFVVYNS